MQVQHVFLEKGANAGKKLKLMSIVNSLFNNF